MPKVTIRYNAVVEYDAGPWSAFGAELGAYGTIQMFPPRTMERAIPIGVVIDVVVLYTTTKSREA